VSLAEAAGGASSCSGAPHLELWGGLVESGDVNVQPTAEACCKSCRAYEPTLDVANGAPCNAWVWHPETHACWLKTQKADDLVHSAKRIADSLAAIADGRPPPKVPWTSGVNLHPRECTDCVPPKIFSGCISKDKCNTSRACGSPAIDGYSHVDPACFDNSPTARRYAQTLQGSAEASHKLVAFSEQAADYDGLGVRWGIGHKKQRWQDCEQACRDHRPSARGGPYSKLPCNVWTWCSRKVCFEPDAHSHSFGDCWLKFSELPEAPEVNMREPMRRAFLRRHRKEMADGVPWVSGALLLPGTAFTNGTWGPRAYW
jgi:hypothetical protein